MKTFRHHNKIVAPNGFYQNWIILFSDLSSKIVVPTYLLLSYVRPWKSSNYPFSSLDPPDPQTGDTETVIGARSVNWSL